MAPAPGLLVCVMESVVVPAPGLLVCVMYVVIVVIGQTVGSISSKTLAYDCLCTLE